MHDLINNLDNALNLGYEIILLGDLNIDTSQKQTRVNNPIYDLCNILNMENLIHDPTRITSSSSTTIDHIITSMSHNHKASGVVEIAISDHYLVYTVLNFYKKFNLPKIVTIRSFKSFDICLFLTDLQTVLGSVKFNVSDNINQAWITWKTIFNAVSKRHAPTRECRVKDRLNPWMSDDILKLMYKRDYIHKKWVETKRESIFHQYKNIRNMITSKIRHAKSDYFTDGINASAGNSRRTWKVLKHALNTSNKNNNVPPSLTSDSLNQYFTSVGPNLAGNFSHGYPIWKLPDSLYSFTFGEITVEYIFSSLNSLSTDSKPDLFGIDRTLLRYAANVITPSLHFLFNMSLTQGVVPSEWKMAQITPIYKGKGNKNSENNYRPISVLPHIAKILEKAVQDQFAKYLTEHNFITPDQSAFLKHHSTQTALHKVVDDWLGIIDKGDIIAICTFDLKKCFDTINHESLLFKLSKCGIKGHSLKWFSSYLTDRTQLVKCPGSTSELLPIATGIPQGSNLGSLLFLIYINDLTSYLPNCYCNLYADDIVVYVAGNNIQNVNSNLQHTVDKIVTWFHDNKLTVNIEKTYTMLISSTNHSDKGFKLDVKIGDIILSQKEEISYLGVTIDSHLTWLPHIANTCKKLAPKIGALSRLRLILPRDSLITVYNSTIQPIFDYCCTVWGQCSDNKLKKIQKFQNRAARIILNNYDWEVNGIDLVRSLNWMTLRERINYFSCSLMYKCINSIAPNYLSDNVLMQDIFNQRSTRTTNQCMVVIPQPRTEIFKQSFAYKGAVLWNMLPINIKLSTSLSQFKYSYKQSPYSHLV